MTGDSLTQVITNLFALYEPAPTYQEKEKELEEFHTTTGETLSRAMARHREHLSTEHWNTSLHENTYFKVFHHRWVKNYNCTPDEEPTKGFY